MDAETIAKACHGSTRARDEIVRELADIWFRFCLSQTRDQDMARDATQETALRFIELLPRFEQRSSIKTWSLGIALNVVREMRRKRRAGSDEMLDTVPDPGDDFSLASDTSEQVEKMKLAMQDLSERQREVVVLRFFENQSVDQTAAVMNCAAGTVKATLHQALRILKSKLSSARPGS